MTFLPFLRPLFWKLILLINFVVVHLHHKLNHKMKTAIIYSSKHGTTEKVARMISDGLSEHETQLISLSVKQPIDLSQFDTIVVGGSIHAGRLNSKVKEFMKEQTVTLLKKRLALFMCGSNEKELQKEFETEFPELLRNHAVSKQMVGGEFIFENMNFMESFMTRKIAGVKTSVSNLKEDAIKQMINDLNK